MDCKLAPGELIQPWDKHFHWANSFVMHWMKAIVTQSTDMMQLQDSEAIIYLIILSEG